MLNVCNIIAVKAKSHPDDPQKLFAVYPLFSFPGIWMDSSSRQEDLAATITQQSKSSALLGFLCNIMRAGLVAQWQTWGINKTVFPLEF